MHTYVRTYIQTFVHTNEQRNARTHACTHACMPERTLTRAITAVFRKVGRRLHCRHRSTNDVPIGKLHLPPEGLSVRGCASKNLLNMRMVSIFNSEAHPLRVGPTFRSVSQPRNDSASVVFSERAPMNISIVRNEKQK